MADEPSPKCEECDGTRLAYCDGLGFIECLACAPAQKAPDSEAVPRTPAWAPMRRGEA